MDAKMCDRCKSLYTIYHGVIRHVDKTVTANGIELMDDYTGVGKFDLCPNCFADFKYFMGIGGERLDKR